MSKDFSCALLVQRRILVGTTDVLTERFFFQGFSLKKEGCDGEWF
jgi:hypothetical protein